MCVLTHHSGPYARAGTTIIEITFTQPAKWNHASRARTRRRARKGHKCEDAVACELQRWRPSEERTGRGERIGRGMSKDDRWLVDDFICNRCAVLNAARQLCFYTFIIFQSSWTVCIAAAAKAARAFAVRPKTAISNAPAASTISLTNDSH